MIKQAIIMLCLMSAPLHSAETVHTEIIDTAAEKWNLSEADWTTYQEIMQGPRGVWNKDADPVLVLGAEAKTAAERKRFAELYVKLENQRVAGELAFQVAVNQAWKDVFPNGQRLAGLPEKAKSANTFKPQRYALIIEPDCVTCDTLLQQHIKILQTSAAISTLDVYFRGTGGDETQLRDFVAASDIPVELIRNEKITVNHGDAYADSNVPEVWVLKEGLWQRQS